MVILGVILLGDIDFFAAVRPSFGGGNVEVDIRIRADDAVTEPLVNYDIINYPLFAGAVLPCPRLIALPFAECAGRQETVSGKELGEEWRVIIWIFLVMISMKF